MTAVLPKELIAPVRSFGRWLVLAVASVAAVIGVAQLWVLGERVPGVDFYQFWLVGTELRYGNAREIYSDQQRTALAKSWLDKAHANESWREYHAAKRRRQLETFSTPLLYMVFAALSTGDYESDYHRYRLLCLAVFVVSIMGLCRVYEYSWRATLLMVALFTGWFWPTRLDVASVQVNMLQLGGLALYVYLQRLTHWRFRQVACGGLLGLMLAFKPNIAFAVALLFLSWLVYGNWHKLIGQAVGLLIAVILAVAASSWAFGSIYCWRDWALALQVLMSSTTWRSSLGNCSLAALLEQTLGGHFQTPIRNGLLLLAAGAVVIARRRSLRKQLQTAAFGETPVFAGNSPDRRVERAVRQDSPQAADEDILVMGLGVAIMLLSSNLVQLHYFLLLLPTAIYCLRPQVPVGASRGRSKELTVAAGSSLLISLIPLHLILPFRAPDLRMTDTLHRWLVNAVTEDIILPFRDSHLTASLCSLGTLLLFALSLRELVRGAAQVDFRATLFQPLQQSPAPIIVAVESVAVGALMVLETRQEA